ncbi:MAG TPA: metal-dependent hydrolase [Vicinamibacterales bacterium]|nr:metal-dependent hydrolase [Vicinamibacterales bacterium]
MPPLSFQWLGHSTFLLHTPGGKRVLFDPWLRGNPACPDALKRPPKVDLILVSHGHGDHIEDLVLVARESGAPVVAVFELCEWLAQKGIQNLSPMNKGGSQSVAGVRVTMTDARHSSAYVEHGQMIYLGEAAGYVLRLEDGRAVYYAGDTSLFGDMRLIGEMYAPEIAFLPIGDRFTMDPVAAAKACELLGVRQVVPMHWGTFPALTGTPAQLKALVEPRGIQVLELKPGDTAE